MVERWKPPLSPYYVPLQPKQPQYYGAGDVVAGITKAFGVKPCNECEKRRQKLNAMMPQVVRRRPY